jgi:hypothetical protein
MAAVAAPGYCFGKPRSLTSQKKTRRARSSLGRISRAAPGSIRIFKLSNHTKQSTEIQINKREALRCERANLGGKDIVRLLRLKLNAASDLRAVSRFPFAAKHLAQVIEALQALQCDVDGRA